jgi:hypothetical protein
LTLMLLNTTVYCEPNSVAGGRLSEKHHSSEEDAAIKPTTLTDGVSSDVEHERRRAFVC